MKLFLLSAFLLSRFCVIMDCRLSFMTMRVHPHARERMEERGASFQEVEATIQRGERFPAKHGRTGFRRNFPFARMWRGTFYHTKQLEVFAIREADDWLVITVITRYF